MMDERLQILEQGWGHVEPRPNGALLTRRTATEREYSNAQIDDKAAGFRWRPPLTMTLRARFSHPASQLRGTAGFGFWNAALGPGLHALRAPRTVWFFFGGPPHDVPLVLGVPGHGFKAAVLDVGRPGFYALLPTAPIGVLLMRVPWAYQRLWPVAQGAIGASEASLDELDLTVWHSYGLRWDLKRVTFSVDDRCVLITPSSPAGPLLFVAWIDNSYAIATPRGRFKIGLVSEPRQQWLEVEQIDIQPVASRDVSVAP